MENKKLKRIKHLKRKKAYARKQEIYEKDPELASLMSLTSDLKHENFWQMPYVERWQIKEGGDDINDICNYVRSASVPFSINWSDHSNNISQRQMLKPLADQNKLIRWQALVSNISVLTDKNGFKHGFILLDKVVKIDPDQTDIYIGFRRAWKDNLLDYHMWLPIDNILYFGTNSVQEIAQGDCVTGCSYIKPYYKNHKRSYGLGKTIITACGIVIGDKHIRAIDGWKTINGIIKSNYSRRDQWMTKLSYQQDYEMQLNRYPDKDLNKLQYLKPKINVQYQTDRQVSYQTRFGKCYEITELPSMDDLLTDD